MEFIFINNYNNIFSSKWAAKPYRSGMDQSVLKEALKQLGHTCEFIHYTDINFRDLDSLRDKYIFYTSSEDEDLFYKSYVEDIIYGLELANIKVIPEYKYLRAHHNKNFMEIIRDLSSNKEIKNIQSNYYGTYEDFHHKIDENNYPLVLKSAFGATSKTVTLISNRKEAIKKIKKFSRSRNFKFEVWDTLRAIRHKGYKKESKYRKKFITQNLIPGMDRDWKILIFGNKYYVLERKVKENDFRASGSGLISYTKELPAGMLDYAEKLYNEHQLPFFAIDVAFDGESFVLIEFQALYFGSHTLDTAPYYFKRDVTNSWHCIEEKSVLEIEVANSIHYLLNKENE